MRAWFHASSIERLVNEATGHNSSRLVLERQFLAKIITAIKKSKNNNNKLEFKKLPQKIPKPISKQNLFSRFQS